MSDSVRPHRWQPTRLPHPWDSPGMNTGVGCHFLLQCVNVKSESKVAQSCPTLLDPMDCSPPGSPVHGLFQAIVEAASKQKDVQVPSDSAESDIRCNVIKHQSERCLGLERVAALTGTISRERQGPSRLTRLPAGPEGRVGRGRCCGDAGSSPRLHAHKAGPQTAPAWLCSVQLSSVQSLSLVPLFATAWTAARQASLSITRSRSLLKLTTSIESAMPSDRLTLCRRLCSRSAPNCCASRPTSFAFFPESLRFPCCPVSEFPFLTRCVAMSAAGRRPVFRGDCAFSPRVAGWGHVTSSGQ